MAPKNSIHTKAIVLARTKLSESDLILSLLLEDGRQARAVAKGARKSNAKSAARCELFCETDFLLAKGKNLDIVTESSLLTNHPNIRADFDRICAAGVVAETLRYTSDIDAPDPYLYKICSSVLTHLENTSSVAHTYLLAAAFVFKVLSHCGWKPQIECCCVCSRAFDPHENIFFSADAGGCVCHTCALKEHDSKMITNTTRLWIKSVIYLTFAELMDAYVSTEQSLELLFLAGSWAGYYLDIKFRSLDFLISTGFMI